MNRRPPTPGPADPSMTAIMPSPNADATAVMRLPSLRDAMAGTSRARPESVLQFPLWRPHPAGTDAPTADATPTVAPPPKRTEQTDIREVAHNVVGHVYRHRFNACHADLEAVPAAVAADHEDVMREALTGIAVIMAELDAVAEGMGFRTASVRRLGRSMALGGMSPDAVLAELHALG